MFLFPPNQETFVDHGTLTEEETFFPNSMTLAIMWRCFFYHSKLQLEGKFKKKTYFFQLSSVEILAESLINEMDEKERDFDRSGNVRAEYLQDVEEIQFWLQRAEAKVQDRSLEPMALKTRLQVRTPNQNVDTIQKQEKIIVI